jgi:hypothetical protein
MWQRLCILLFVGRKHTITTRRTGWLNVLLEDHLQCISYFSVIYYYLARKCFF